MKYRYALIFGFIFVNLVTNAQEIEWSVFPVWKDRASVEFIYQDDKAKVFLSRDKKKFRPNHRLDILPDEGEPFSHYFKNEKGKTRVTPYDILDFAGNKYLHLYGLGLYKMASDMRTYEESPSLSSVFGLKKFGDFIVEFQLENTSGIKASINPKGDKLIYKPTVYDREFNRLWSHSIQVSSEKDGAVDLVGLSLDAEKMIFKETIQEDKPQRPSFRFIFVDRDGNETYIDHGPEEGFYLNAHPIIHNKELVVISEYLGEEANVGAATYMSAMRLGSAIRTNDLASHRPNYRSKGWVDTWYIKRYNLEGNKIGETRFQFEGEATSLMEEIRDPEYSLDWIVPMGEDLLLLARNAQMERKSEHISPSPSNPQGSFSSVQVWESKGMTVLRYDGQTNGVSHIANLDFNEATRASEFMGVVVSQSYRTNVVLDQVDNTLSYHTIEKVKKIKEAQIVSFKIELETGQVQKTNYSEKHNNLSSLLPFSSNWLRNNRVEFVWPGKKGQYYFGGFDLE